MKQIGFKAAAYKNGTDAEIRANSGDSASRLMQQWHVDFLTLLNVQGVSDVRQNEIHSAEPLVPEPGALEFEMAIEKLKRHKQLGFA